MSYLSLTDDDREAMLEAVGVASLDELFEQIPEAVRFERELEVPPALPEAELVRTFAELAARNADTSRELSFLGMGIYDHYVPALVDAFLSRGELLTAHPPAASSGRTRRLPAAHPQSSGAQSAGPVRCENHYHSQPPAA